ncbi:related to beta-1,6-glucanase precursor [Melanopsichium pennsylvanicum]|uniref:Related to beta-1,6-glucanase n=1 Tax=Melanopsichium pennsylvanicum TaxID=63383 RepID=A0AAJ4XMT7_9BASI|nr:related to beta-1,6-glucanase precursor [Melanopsichium pennsylvanicum]
MRTIKSFPVLVAFVAASARLAMCETFIIDRMWSTNWNGSQVQEFHNPGLKFVPGTPLTVSVNVTAEESARAGGHHDLIGINIHENQVHQMVDTIGGGITDSVAINLQDFKDKSPKEYGDLLNLLFSQDPAWWVRGGAALNTVRVPLGASDFGVSPYTYDDTEDGSEDQNLELFTIQKAPKLWKTLKDIVAINSKLKMVVAPWSAPGWMKENTNADQPLFGGHLKAGMEEVFAKYLIKSVVTIKKEEGLDIFALSLLNEPQMGEQQYPTMKMSADQAVKVGRLVRDGLDRAGFKSVKMLAWDFNWDNPQYALDVLNADPTPWSGVAWHGYSGQPQSQLVVANAYPDKDTYFTEFTQITQFFSEPYKNMKNTARNLIIASIRDMSRSLISWNLVLRKDEDGFTTPHLPKVCDNCNSAILLLPQSTDGSLTSGDPNHTKTVAEANGVSNAEMKVSIDKRDPAAAPGGVSVASDSGTSAPGGVSVASDSGTSNPGAAHRAGATDRAGATHRAGAIRPIGVADFAGAPTAQHEHSVIRRASTPRIETLTFAPASAQLKGDKFKSDQAVLASKVIDVKKTGNPQVYSSDLFKRTSDFSVLSHLSAAVRPTGDSKQYSRRIGVKSTDETSELGGRLLAQAFRQDGVKSGITRFSVVLLNQNDHYETGVFEEVTANIAFRGQVVNVTTPPGLFTFSWEAPTMEPVSLKEQQASVPDVSTGADQ